MGVKTWVVAAVVCAGCDGGTSRGTDASIDAPVDAPVDAFVVPYNTELLRIPITANRDLDLLFVIDDSPATLELQSALKTTSLPILIDVLNGTTGGLPNMHIGVVSTDLGTKGSQDATAGAPVGTSGTPGSCAGNGKSGNLQTNGTTLVYGNFISDIKSSDGSRTTNYTGTLVAALNAIASLGSAGCEFEQPIEAAKRALNNNPANAGFLRQTANLALVFVTNEDDCSLSHSTLLSSDPSTLGPLTSFRCTRFGVTCDTAGATSTMMAEPGVKGGCHASAATDYLTDVATYATYLNGLKADPRMVFVGAIAGPTQPFEVTSGPTLAPSCADTGANISAAPAVRVHQLVDQFPDTSSFATACTSDLSEAAARIGMVLAKVVGNSCLFTPLPTDCIVTEQHTSGIDVVPSCTGTQARPCWQVVTDPANCGANAHLRFDVLRDQPPPLDSLVSVRCRP